MKQQTRNHPRRKGRTGIGTEVERRKGGGNTQGTTMTKEEIGKGSMGEKTSYGTCKPRGKQRRQVPPRLHWHANA